MKGGRRGEDTPAERVLSPLALPAGTRVGRWRVVRQVGQGGFGTVYAVKDADAPTGPMYALKLARTPEDAGFGREAEALRRVHHPGVARLVEAGRWEAGAAGHPYLVLEYVRGEDLYRWARLRNPAARQVAGLLLQVAEALAAAHAQGVLHRDFKGGNVLVRPDGRLVVLDWGAGIYPQAAPLTCTGRMPPGTPVYYSPHVMAWRTRALRGGGGRYPYTAADEAYAVGVTFYRLMSDEYPPLQLGWGAADAEEPSGLLAPQPLAHLNPRVPEPLAALVMRLLAFRPEARPAHMAALADAVRGLLEGAGDAWDVPLFEWYAGPSSHSRTTVDDDRWGPMAPGHEAALVRDRRRRPDVRDNKAVERWLRRRHPQARAPHEEEDAAAWEPAHAQAPDEAPRLAVPEPAPPPAQDAAPPEKARPAREPMPASKLAGSAATPEAPGQGKPVAPEALVTSPWLRGSRAVAVLALLVAAGFAGALVRERTRAPVPADALEVAARELAPPSGPPHAGDAGAPLTASPPPPPSSLQEQPMPSSATPPGRARGLISTLKHGALACGAAASVACSGASVRPPSDTRCPDEALKAMRELRLTPGMVVKIYVREDKKGYGNDLLFVQDGEIVSRVYASRTLPDDTLVKGWLWTRARKDTVIGHYTELELPDGRRYPVCLVLCNKLGCGKGDESTPDAAAITRAAAFTVVDSF